MGVNGSIDTKSRKETFSTPERAVITANENADFEYALAA
jgi:hypothetical protein